MDITTTAPASTAKAAESASLSNATFRKRFAMDAGLVLGLAVILRLVFYLISNAQPEHRQHADDSLGYMTLAQNINNGLGFGRTVSTNDAMPEVWLPELCRTPGYPWLVAVTTHDVAQNNVPILALQNLMELAICGTVFALCYLAFGRIPGLSAGLLMAVDIQGIAFTDMILTETAFSIFYVAAAFTAAKIMGRRGMLWGTVTGLLLGLSVLIRPTTLYLPILIAFFLVGYAVYRRHFISVVTAVLVLGAGYAPVVAWMARNKSVCGEFTLTSVSRDGLLSCITADTLAKGKGISSTAALKELSDRLNVNRAQVRFSAFSSEDEKRIKKATLETIREYPVGFTSQLLVKSVNLLFGPDKYVLQVLGIPQTSFGIMHDSSATGNQWGILLLGFEVIFTLVVYAGVLRTLLQAWRGRSFPMWVWSCFWVALYVLGISAALCAGDPRYRSPTMPLLIIVAAASMVRRSPEPAVSKPVIS
jgi:hypothetical protein